MKSKIVQHKSRFKTGVVPMVLLGDNAVEIATEILRTSDYCKDITPEFDVKEGDVCILDPGGMFFTGTPYMRIEVEGVKFDIQPTKIEDVLWHMDSAKERIPGYMRFRMWLWNMVFPVHIHDALKAKLKSMALDDTVIHAHLNENAAKAKIEADCPNVKFNIPRERH